MKTSRFARAATASVCAIVLLASLALWWQYSRAPEPVAVTIGTGPAGGVYDEVGRGLAEVGADSGTAIEARLTAASVENIQLVHQGDLDGGFTLSDIAALAVEGQSPFDGPQDIRAVARLYDNHTHLIVRADSPYSEVAELAGARVSLGAERSGTEIIAERLLELSGVAHGPNAATALRLDLEESAAALESDEIDAFFWSGGLPTAAVHDLAERLPIRLIDLSEHLPALTERYGHHYVDAPIVASTYPGVDAVRTIGVPSLLVVSAHMSDDEAWALTKTVMESRGQLAQVHPATLQLSPRSAISTMPVPLHPGAAAYYRETKVYH